MWRFGLSRAAAALVLGVTAIVTASCGSRAPEAPAATGDAQLSDIERTWYDAVVAFPPATLGGPVDIRRMHDVIASPPVDPRPRTTVIYLHGCTGLGDLSVVKYLAAEGFVVIAPDSMARKYRPLQCDAATGRGGYNLFVYDFRATELAFAIHSVSRMPWADVGDMFLIGGSEGGVTAALYRGEAFRGRVIAAWTCHGAPLVAGLDAPPMEPVLSIVSADDPWYSGRAAVGQAGDCGTYMPGRPNARSLVLPSGEGHAVLNSRVARQAIVDFITLWRRP
ncbi:hypothetical protein [Zavarzinia compransoris]|nr:hypothetical protein [Zavarzinia compransoris]